MFPSARMHIYLNKFNFIIVCLSTIFSPLLSFFFWSSLSINSFVVLFEESFTVKMSEIIWWKVCLLDFILFLSLSMNEKAKNEMYKMSETEVVLEIYYLSSRILKNSNNFIVSFINYLFLGKWWCACQRLEFKSSKKFTLIQQIIPFSLYFPIFRFTNFPIFLFASFSFWCLV